jgi:hypothetical protein
MKQRAAKIRKEIQLRLYVIICTVQIQSLHKKWLLPCASSHIGLSFTLAVNNQDLLAALCEVWSRTRGILISQLYSSPNIVRVVKSRRLRWAGHVACMGQGRGVYRVLVGKPKVRAHWEDLGVGGRITLSWTSGRQGSMGRTGFGWLGIGPSRGLLWTR